MRHALALVCLTVVVPNDALAQFKFDKSERGEDFSLGTDGRDFSLDLRSLNRESYSYNFHFQVPDLEGVTDDASLQALDIKTRRGEQVQHRVLIEQEGRQLIVGTLREERKVRISSFSFEKDVPQFTLSLPSDNPNDTSAARSDDFVVFDDGRQECYDFQRASEADVDINIAIAIDISGSMSGFEQQLNSSIQSFADIVGSDAQCSLIEFNHGYEYKLGSSRSGELCSALKRYSVSTPSGGTAAFPAMAAMYDTLSTANSDLSLAIVVSDGLSSNEGFEDALARKGKIPTFINWLGNYDPNYPLEQFADAEIFGVEEQDGSLPEFFGAAGGTVSGQFVAYPCGY